MKREIGLLAVLAVFTISLPACDGGGDGAGTGDTGSDATGQGKIPVTIYYQGAMTGDFSYLVIPSVQGAELHFEELNADPDFPARITLVRGDTQGESANAPIVIEQAVSDPTTVAVLGPAFNGESDSSGAEYEANRIPFITASAAAAFLADKEWAYWYRIVGSDLRQGPLAAKYLAQRLDVPSVFVAHDKGVYGQGLAELVRKTLVKEGVKVAGFEGITSGAEDFSTFIAKVTNSGADALFFGGYDTDFGRIVAESREQGVGIELMSADGSVSATFLDLAGADADGVHLIAPTDLSNDFIDQYNQRYSGEASSVPVYAAEAYDGAGLVAEGIKRAIEGGATSPESIRQGIKEYLDSLTLDAPYEGVTGPIAFNDQHELDAADPNSLYYFYEVAGEELDQLGSATEVLQG